MCYATDDLCFLGMGTLCNPPPPWGGGLRGSWDANYPPPPQGASGQQLVVKGMNPRSQWASKAPNGGMLARWACAGHLFLPVPHRWPFRGCTKGAHLAQCSYLGVWLY